MNRHTRTLSAFSAASILALLISVMAIAQWMTTVPKGDIQAPLGPTGIPSPQPTIKIRLTAVEKDQESA